MLWPASPMSELQTKKSWLFTLLLFTFHFSPFTLSAQADNDSASWNQRFTQMLRWTYVDTSLASVYGLTDSTFHSPLRTHNSELITKYLPLRWYGYRFQPSDQWPVVYLVAVGDGPERILTLPALQQLAQWGAFLTNDDHRRLRLAEMQRQQEQHRQDTLLRRQLDSLDNLAHTLRIEADSLEATLEADSLETISRQRADEITRAKQRMNRDQIFILNVKTARSEYMFGLELNLYNPFDRTISMLEFNVAPYNDRGQVQEDKFHRTVRTMRCMGPIAPEAPAQYTFDELFWNDRGRIKFMRINSITFYFTDGTSKSFNGYKNVMKHTLR